MSRLSRVTIASVAVAASLVVLFTPIATASGVITGVVRAGDGTPIAGAEVWIFDETGKGTAESTTTAADGTYSMEDCASCVGEMAANAPGYYMQRGGPDFTLFEMPNTHISSAGLTTLRVSWAPVPGAVAYRVTFADDRYFTHPKIVFRTQLTTQLYKNLVKGHIYYVKVNPIDADGHLIREDYLKPQKPTAGRPGYVNDLHSVAKTSASLALAWAPFKFASCCTEYQVQISNSPTFAAYRTRWVLNGDETITFGTLTSHTAYYVRVRARNASHTYTTPWSGIKQTSTS